MIKNALDYYPFGMTVPNRNYSSPSYRYGFQGQEKDDEIKGNGNSINYKFRMHDPRVGRFFAVDPLSPQYPHYTPYSFSGNKVIAFMELEGLEELDFKVHMAIHQGKPLTGIVSYTFDWYNDKAKSKVDAAGRGIDNFIQGIAPIRPNTQEEMKMVEDAGGHWEFFKQTPSRIKKIPENVSKAINQYKEIQEFGTVEEKIESNVTLVGTLVSVLKGKTPKGSLLKVAQAGFNPKTGIVSWINKIKNIKIEIPLPKSFEQVKVTGSKADVFKKKGKKEWITPDLDGHNNGFWKKAKGKAENLFKKETREGTYNADLSERIGG